MRAAFLLGWFWLLGMGAANGQTPSANVPPVTSPHLRVWCAHPGNVKPAQFGDWPAFQPSLRLIFSGGAGGEQILSSGLLPLSTLGYFPLPAGSGKLLLQETPPEDSKSPPATVASLPFAPKAGKFYSLVIQAKNPGFVLEILEDDPAILPPSKPDEEPPPPQRSLRCLIFEQDTTVEITCPECSLDLKGATGKVSEIKNLKAGIWNLKVKGRSGEKSFQRTVEFDLASPGNWTIFFMKDIYGRVGPFLQKDASLD
jgi:hypothetical protein